MVLKVIGGIKGGPGKTTIVTNVAAMRAHDRTPRGLFLIDADDIKQSYIWGLRRPPTSPIVEVDIAAVDEQGLIIHQLQKSIKKYSDVLVDCGGFDSAELRQALGFAEELIVPLRATQHDYDALPGLDDLVQEVKAEHNKRLKIRVLICQCPPNKEEEIRKEVEERVAEYKLLRHVMKTITTFRHHSYPPCQSRGQGVIEFASKREVAYREMMSLHKEIWG